MHSTRNGRHRRESCSNTYLIFALAFSVLHSQWSLVALDIGSLHDAVVCAKFAFRSGVDQSHILEGTAAHENARLARDRASLWLDGVNREADLITCVLNRELRLLALLVFCEREDGHIVGVDLASFGFILRWLRTLQGAICLHDLAQISVAI